MNPATHACALSPFSALSLLCLTLELRSVAIDRSLSFPSFFLTFCCASPLPSSLIRPDPVPRAAATYTLPLSFSRRPLSSPFLISRRQSRRTVDVPVRKAAAAGHLRHKEVKGAIVVLQRAAAPCRHIGRGAVGRHKARARRRHVLRAEVLAAVAAPPLVALAGAAGLHLPAVEAAGRRRRQRSDGGSGGGGEGEGEGEERRKETKAVESVARGRVG